MRSLPLIRRTHAFAHPNEYFVTATRRRLSSGKDWKGQFNTMFAQTSKKASEVAKRQTDQALGVLQSQAKQSSERLAVEAKKVSDKVVSEAKRAFDKGATTAKVTLKSSSQKVAETIQSTVSHTGKAINETSRQAVDAASERMRTSSLGVLTNAQAFAVKGIRWAALWSLAAIFVYGVATSIPGAFIRHVFSGKEDRGTDQKDKAHEINKPWWA